MEKENKKVKKNKVKIQTAEQLEIRNFLIVILVVLLCVGGIYLATRLFVTKDLGKNNDNQTQEETVSGTINYETAIMGTILNKADKEYYVAIYDQSDKGKYFADMLTLMFAYAEKENSLPVYTVDLANKLNADYYDPENVNVKATSVKDMKVGDITLLRVKKGKITKYIVDYAKMEKELGVNEK